MKWYKDFAVELDRTLKNEIIKKEPQEDDKAFLARCQKAKESATEKISKIEGRIKKELREVKPQAQKATTTQEKVDHTQMVTELNNILKSISYFYKKTKFDNCKIIFKPTFQTGKINLNLKNFKNTTTEKELENLTKDQIHKHLDKNIFKLFGKDRYVVFNGKFEVFPEKTGYQHIEKLLSNPQKNFSHIEMYREWFAKNSLASDKVERTIVNNSDLNSADLENLSKKDVSNNKKANKYIKELNESIKKLNHKREHGDFTHDDLEDLEQKKRELEELRLKIRGLKKVYDRIEKRIKDARKSFVKFPEFYKHINIFLNKHEYQEYIHYSYTPEKQIHWFT